MAVSPQSSTPTLILGAGLAGLSTALHLRQAGGEARLLEQASFVGGHATTIEDSGYRFDRTGHLLHLRDPDMRALVTGLLGDRLLTVERRSRVYSHGVYTRYPFQANTFGLPPAVAHECVMGFLRAREAAPAGATDDFASWCRARFGDGFCRHFLLPYNEKLWGVPASEITAAWCRRFVPVPSVDDVIAGAVGLNDRELGYNASFVYPRGGIGELPAALARAAGPVELGRRPQAIDWRRRRVTLADETIAYERLVSTVPLRALGALLVDPPDEVARAFGQLRCAGLRYLDVALRAPVGRDLHWVYVPEARYPFYRVGCYSHFSPDLTPAGGGSLYVELADRRPDASPDAVPRVIALLVEMGLIGHPDEVAFVRERHLPYAYVLFDHAHAAAVACIEAFLGACGIESTGRYGRWTYSSMEDALLDGRAAARSLGT
ncbi:MAG: hypothetical protein EOO75_14460 [Myxococcales bacterium]|nr:MAG: hypothetical protein EOO75_14460 [Myxococcales bacterium]